MAQRLENRSAEEIVSELTSLIEKVVGLDTHQARTVVYYSIATHAVGVLTKFPILDISGPPGTGKTTLLQILKQICHQPIEIDGKVSRAVLRDSLRAKTTALIEEADEVHEPWLINRYSMESAATTVNRKSMERGWAQEKRNLFGATVLHRRRPFRDPAVLSRSIAIRTRKKNDIVPYRAVDFEPYQEALKQIKDRVDWGHVPERGGSRIKDTWAPLLEVDALFQGAWTDFALVEIEKAENNLHLGQGEEPSQAVFSTLLSLALAEEGTVVERVLLADIGKTLPVELDLNSWQVGQLLRDLGFTTKPTGGKGYVYTGGREKLVEAGLGLGIQDDWLEEQRP